MDLMQLFVVLTPILVYIATWIAGKLLPLIPGWMTLSVAGVLSMILTWLMSLAATPGLEWYWQFLLGMFSVVISQIIKQFAPSKIASDVVSIKQLTAKKK